MSNIWEVCPAASRYLCVQQNDLRHFADRFNGASMAPGWVAPTFNVLNKSKKVADFISWQIGSQTFLVSRRAKEAVSDLSGDDVEFLSFAVIKGTELFAVNVVRQLDVIESAESEIAGVGMEPFVLKSDINELPVLFKDRRNTTTTFASDALGALAVQQRLAGLRLANPRKITLQMIMRGEEINEYPGL